MKITSPRNWISRWRESTSKYNEAMRHREDMKVFYSIFVNPGDLCFDIGANMGNRTDILSDMGCRVISVEPQPLCLRRLRSLFGKKGNVVIVEAAAGEREGMGELAVCEDEPTISTMSRRWMTEGRFAETNQWNQKIKVPMTTLDTLISLHGAPRFCKIDVEGFELSVIKGLSVPVNYISFEFTKEFFDDAIRCMEHLLTIGPAVFNVSYGESMKLLEKEWVTSRELRERLEQEKDPLLWGDIYVKFPTDLHLSQS